MPYSVSTMCFLNKNITNTKHKHTKITLKQVLLQKYTHKSCEKNNIHIICKNGGDIDRKVQAGWIAGCDVGRKGVFGSSLSITCIICIRTGKCQCLGIFFSSFWGSSFFYSLVSLSSLDWIPSHKTFTTWSVYSSLGVSSFSGLFLLHLLHSELCAVEFEEPSTIPTAISSIDHYFCRIVRTVFRLHDPLQKWQLVVQCIRSFLCTWRPIFAILWCSLL